MNHDDAGTYWIEVIDTKWYLCCEAEEDPIAEFDTPAQAQNELDRRTGRRDRDC